MASLFGMVRNLENLEYVEYPGVSPSMENAGNHLGILHRHRRGTSDQKLRILAAGKIYFMNRR